MRFKFYAAASILLSCFLPPLLYAQPTDNCGSTPVEIRVDQGHPWKPPFGLDRVGAPPVAHVEWKSEKLPLGEYFLITYNNGHESGRLQLNPKQDPLPGQPRKTDTRHFFANVSLKSIPTEVVVIAQCARYQKPKEVARQPVNWPHLEADAEAHPHHQINPIDLGAIFVSHDQLLLRPGQRTIIDIAVLSHYRDFPDAQLKTSFNGSQSLKQSFPITKSKRQATTLEIPLTANTNSTLTVSLTDANRALWKKDIRTFVALNPPKKPTFAAIETKLRYDAPIVVKDPKTGDPRPPINYATAWDPKLNDIVVFLPNGSRFVFWRGASYIPMWASPNNTGVSYQWAENLSHPVPHADGTIDFREPMFDSELRYGRVKIIESTASRIHVRWSYQLTTLDYSVLNDQATEDFYFYPDGFGTRVITLMSTPGDRYQLTEFIIVTPQDAYPLDVLPAHLADVLYLDGRNDRITFPVHPLSGASKQKPLYVSDPRNQPRVVRLFQHKNDPAAAIYFQPGEITTPNAYASFHDQGEEVTPVYWASHWPLTRGKWTHWTIDDGIHTGPAHNSVLSVGYDLPNPVYLSELAMPDGKGQVQSMTVRRWSALIAKTDASDQELIAWAQSFSAPPSLDVRGARIAFPSYSPERRALRIVAESPDIEIQLKPTMHTMNPVFEIEGAGQKLESITLDGKALPADAYAWDGKTLWTRADIGSAGGKITLQFR